MRTICHHYRRNLSICIKSKPSTNTIKKYDVRIVSKGGGIHGQTGAMSLAIARSLVMINEEYRAQLREQGLLTRDSRMKERKKAGRPGARKRFQFSKR